MSQTKVIHIKDAPRDWKSNPDYVYIGRAGKGEAGYFGNPVRWGVKCPICKEQHRDNESLVKCYRVYFRRRIEKDKEFKQKVFDLKGKTLICFCVPKPCHGNIIVEYLEQQP